MFDNEEFIKYEKLFAENNIEYHDCQELKSILEQLYLYGKIVYEQFKIKNYEKE